MKTISSSNKTWVQLTHELGKEFEARAAEYDLTGSFVHENYRQLKENKFFSAAIPVELGGSGLSHSKMCHLIRIIAHYCGSTALAFSMHQHLIAAAVWKYVHNNEGAEMLKNVAKHELALISTGARDWLGSNGEMKRTKGGYLFSGKKHFASQSAGADVAVTSAPHENENSLSKVLHFSVPMNSSGVSVLDNWDVMGMRATGSQTIVFDQVFIPDSAISLQRPRDAFHPVWHVVLTVALPLIMSAYVGIAEKAQQIAIEKGKNYGRNKNFIAGMVGRMNNALLSARTGWKAMYHLTNSYEFAPREETTIAMLSHKTNVGDAAKRTVELAMEAIGGQSFYRSNILERLFRDVQASPFHPLPKWEQYEFTGERILKQSSKDERNIQGHKFIALAS
jgi:alkylation response protein AidB-like acyl-CoA dehydrogenase